MYSGVLSRVRGKGTKLMKKIIGTLACLLLFAGCAQEEAETFGLTADEQQAYTKSIDAVIEEHYWEYDRGSLQFSAGIVPENRDKNERLFEASAACGYNLSGYAGKELVQAEATLLHYNGDRAGTLQCYLQQGQLVGIAYAGGYDKGYYSLKERNPFQADGGFERYETWNGMNDAFVKGTGEFSPEGLATVGRDEKGNTLAAVLQNGKALVYRYANGLSRLRQFSYGTGLEAASAVFLSENDARLAVLLISSEQNNESESEGEEASARSEKIVLYDSQLNQTGEILLESELATALGAEDGKLYVFVEQNMDIYEEKEGVWERTGSRKLKHWVQQFHITDLDGDGVKEYLMTDGMDLYVYQQTGGSFRRIWSTHIGVENFYGPIISGDLNGDSVKEIYVCDMTGTTIRYILTEEGLRTANEDIDYGECIYPCDFDGKGGMDYWLVQDNINRGGQLYLAQTKTEERK